MRQMPRSFPAPGPSRRRFLQLGGGAAALGLTTACAGDRDSGAVGWQAIPSYSLQSPDPKRAAYLKRRLASFRKRTARGIRPLVAGNDTTAAMAKLLLQASQGRAPHIAQVDSYIFGRVAPYARPLDQQLARLGLRADDWFPSMRASMTTGDGAVRGLQFTSDVRVLYYRRDLVDDPPATWDEMTDLGARLARDGHGVLFPAGRSEGAVTTTLWPAYWAQGADLFDTDGQPAFASGKGYDAMRACLRAVQRAVERGAAPRRVAGYDQEDDANPDIVAGRVAMFLGGSWQAALLDSLMKDADFHRDWGVAPMPVISGDPVSATGGWMWAAFTDDPAALRTGLDWVHEAYLSDEGMAAWCTLGGYLPPRQRIYDHPDYAQSPFTPVFRDHLARYGRARPGDRKYQEVSQTLQIALSSVASGTTDANEALDQALDRLV
ncbi:extracellular solute-binding protein [Streptomyces sp. DSM 42041]|uniref:Extracellular solute-binding protein n=1 Tax=Streptomyces hazeniae TaxID=3075538 RepID=A0ABU2NZU4_9ACTN|nr:extracellular solute-binding protein [Streptomyces sp. DSM 42041]MDT0382512.1 extracellular solute-binding protein [Streptomyces sp. DSM 42041]